MKSPAHAALVVESPVHDVQQRAGAKEILTVCVSFCTQWFDVCVCIRVRGLHLVSFGRLGKDCWSGQGRSGVVSKEMACLAMLRLSYAQVRSFCGHVKANSGSKFDRFVALPPLG